MPPAALAALVRQRLRSRAVVLNTMVCMEPAISVCPQLLSQLTLSMPPPQVCMEPAINTNGDKWSRMMALPAGEVRSRLAILKNNHEFVRSRFLQVRLCLGPQLAD